MIYATNKEWLGTLVYDLKPGEAYLMSEGGVMCATCIIGTLKDENGNLVPVPDGLEEIQRKYCRNA